MALKTLRTRYLLVVSYLFAAAGLLALASCAGRPGLLEIAGEPHRGLIPVLKMGEHLKRGLECTDCHAGAKTEARAGLPTRAICMECHADLEAHRADLALGGPLFEADGRPKWRAVNQLPVDVTFAHAKHTQALACTECHGHIEHDQYALADLASRFANCRRCHAREVENNHCTYCHSAFDKTLRPHTHDAAWRFTHGTELRDRGGYESLDRTSCTACHAESACRQCHQEEKPRDHTAFWDRAGHGLAADVDRGRCAVCHTEDRCARCHQAQAPPRPPGHLSSACDTCHTGLRQHVILTDNCLLCHQ